MPSTRARVGLVIVVQLLSHVRLFATPWTAACLTSLSVTISWSLLKLMSIESVMPSNHLILCCPLLLLPSIFPSIRVFSNESALRVRWPKYCSFSFSISPSNEYSGLISFKTDWFISLVIFSPKSLEAWIPRGLWSDPEQSRQQPLQKGSMKSTLPGCLKATQVQQWDPSLLRLPGMGSQPQSAGSG